MIVKKNKQKLQIAESAFKKHLKAVSLRVSAQAKSWGREARKDEEEGRTSPWPD